MIKDNDPVDCLDEINDKRRVFYVPSLQKFLVVKQHFKNNYTLFEYLFM